MCFAQKIIETLKVGKLPPESQVKLLCTKIKEKLINYPNVVNVNPPVVIVGDIHGQFYDLLEIFEISGECPDTNFLFLGDYVDRGYHSVETLTMLLALKLKYPTKMTLLRGNHESKAISEIYGFYDECMKKYGTMMYKMFVSVFDLLPISAVVGNKVFLVHGGLSPNINHISEINKFDRKQDIKDSGTLANLCWSDPDDTIKTDWEQSPRGSGFLFGKNPVIKFLHTNNIDRIVRAHQLCQEGYQQLFSNTLITVFSAPNYCYQCGNMGAIFEIYEDLTYHISQFDPADDQTGGIGKDNKNIATSSYFL